MLTDFRRLPLYAALAAFALYLATMGAGASFNNLALILKFSGWSDAPFMGQPLLWLLTLPFHLLPVAWVAMTLKLFSAGLAAGIIGILIRTIQLLPWDHSWDNASRRVAALPLLTGGILCGLEFNFWQQATTLPGDLLDLLLLAAGVWLLREYKAGKNTRWLDAAAVVWGVGMAQNWVMLLTLPFFIGSIAGMMRGKFFNKQFILRMFGLGAAGASIYILLPMVNGLGAGQHPSLGESWMASLRQTKNFLFLPRDFWRGNRLLTLGIAVYFLVPLLPLIVRMRDEGMRNKSGVDIFQLIIYRTLRVALLGACFWLALDPVTGARQLVQQRFNSASAMLTLDYVTALAAAFLIGNLLLVTEPVPARDGLYRKRKQFPWRKVAVPGASAAVVLMLLVLTVRNGPAISHLNFLPVETFGATAVKSLPPGRGVVFSDVPLELDVFKLALAHSPHAADWLPVDTKDLATVEYRRKLEQLRPDGWLTEKNNHELTILEQLQLLAQIAQSNRLFYLHPSFGYFFEGFYVAPTGSLYEMKLRGLDPLKVPPLAGDEVEHNERFWSALWQRQLARLAPPKGPGNLIEKKMKRFGLVRAPRTQDQVLAQWYAIHLDAWAVELQKLGKYPEAQAHLEEALLLNTNNWSARITLSCNTNLQAGAHFGLQGVAQAAAQLGNVDQITLVMKACGPVDDATFAYILGSSYLDRGQLVQAAEQIERVRTLTAGAMMAEMALVEIYNRLHMSDRSQPLILRLREEAKKLPANSSLDLNLALMESYTWLLQTNKENARNALESVVEQHPDDPEIKRRVLAAYLSYGDTTNALRITEEQLARAPDDVASLNNQAVILIQMGRSVEAIPLLDRVLAITNQPSARLNRGLAYLTRNEFAFAAVDFHELQKENDAIPMVNFGLGVVAEQNHNTNEAIHYFNKCLTNTPTGSGIWLQAMAKLRALQPVGADK